MPNFKQTIYRFTLLSIIIFSAVLIVAQSTESATVYGTVFNDTNNNGQLDTNEAGIAGVVIVAIEEDTGAPITATTDADGNYTIEADIINHRIRVDENTLPFSGELTTNRLEYNLNVPPAYFAPNINFGYQEITPATVYGTVFNDTNGDGIQDEGETGISGVTLIAEHDETGAITTLTTDSNGDYTFESTGIINHQLYVDVSTLPFTAQLTTGREQYNLNVPANYFAPNINFGYQEIEPANVYGTVFNDTNGDGIQDEGEMGISGVTLIAEHDETGVITTLTTDSNGDYNFTGNAEINHQFYVDVSTLPFTAQLTTGREQYNLNVPPEFFAPNINFGYQEIEPANVYGTVFNDTNGDGIQDEGETGISGVTLIAEHDETGVITTLTTDSNGDYTFTGNAEINHQFYVDVSTLPFTAQLTTGREQYNLNVPPEFFAPNISFGYQEIEPSVVSGTVFNDRNSDGIQDEGEDGIPNAELIVSYGDTMTTITTNADGTYRYEDSQERFTLAINESTLPFADPILTTGRDTFTLNIPNGFIAPNVNFGYRAATSDDYPDIQAVSGSSNTVNSDGNGSGNTDDGLVNPFDNPDENLPPTDDLPDDAGTYALPLEGTWTNYNGSLAFNCGGMSFDQPPAPPETVTIEIRDGGQTLFGQGFDGNTNTLTASDTIRGLYTGTITVSQDGGTVTLDFYLQVVTPEYAIGYLTGDVQAQGVSCTAYRPFEMEYVGE